MWCASSARSSRTESNTQAGSLRVTLEVPARARLGEPVPLVFHVANAGPAEITLAVQGREATADFAVTDLRGRVIWSLLKGQIVLGSLRLLPFASGKRLTFRHLWRQRSDAGTPVAAGDYLVRAALLTDAPGGLASPSSRLRIARP